MIRNIESRVHWFWVRLSFKQRNALMYWYFTYGKKIFGEEALLWKVLQFQPLYSKLVLIVNISKLKELITQL